MSETLRTARGAIGAAFRSIGRFIVRHKKLFIVLAALIIVAAVVLYLLSGRSVSAQAANQPPQTTQLAQMDLQQTVAGTGTLQSSGPREVTSTLSYEVQGVHVKEGDKVSVGQMLATLDTTQLDKDIADARESIAEAAAKDALSLSQAQRKLQDAIDSRDINWAKNEAAVQAAATAIEQARVAAGTTALENAAVADATAKTAAAASTLSAAEAARAAAQGAYNQKEIAYQTVLGQQNLYNATADGAEQASLLALWGYPDVNALNSAVTDAYGAMSAETANVQAAQTAVSAAQSGYDSAYSTAYNDFKKNNQPIYTAAYNAADVSGLQTSYDNAVQARDTQRRTDTISIENAQDSIDSQKLQDSAASYRTQLEGLLEDKEDCIITAPVAGTITSMTAEVGKSAGGSAAGATGSAAGASGSTASASSALFTIENTNGLEITASIPEYDMVNLQEGMQVTITTDALADQEWIGQVASVSPKATDDSGNFTMVVDVVSETGELAIGMSAKINIITDSKAGVFAVPYDAVTTNGQGETVVYALDEDPADTAQSTAQGEAEARRSEIKVATGMETDYYIEITGEGLKEGLLILSDPEGRNVSAAEAATGTDAMMEGRMGMGG